MRALMYHISPRANRESIEREGLRLDYYGNYVWVFRDYSTAERFAEQSWGAVRENDIWEVDVRGLRVIDDPHPGWEGVESFALTTAIPLERLRRVDRELHFPQCRQKQIRREQCYVCHRLAGETYVYDPDARCPYCDAVIPLSGHTCSGLIEATRKEQ